MTTMAYELAQKCLKLRERGILCQHSRSVSFASKGDFCGSFCHVREYKKAEQTSGKFDETCLELLHFCLHKEECLLGRAAAFNRNWLTGAKYAFAVVSLTNWRKTYTKMYSNCFNYDVTKHAEDFLCEDAYDGDLSRALESCILGKMIVYITIQPCHFSKLPGNKNCTERLLELKRIIAKQHRTIRMVIKIAFLHKAHWFFEDKESYTAIEIENAKEGLKLLYRSGIQVEAMTRHDWIELIRIGKLNLDINEIYYSGSPRVEMDQFIRQFLENIRFSI